MLMMAPPPDSFRAGNAAELMLNTPTVSISMTVLKPCGKNKRWARGAWLGVSFVLACDEAETAPQTGPQLNRSRACSMPWRFSVGLDVRVHWGGYL